MKRWKELLLLLLIVFLTLALVGCPFNLGQLFTPNLPEESSLSGGTLFLETSQPLPVKKDSIMDLKVTGIKSLKGYSITLNYDSTQLTIREVKEGDFFSSTDQPTFFYQQVNPDEGTVQIDSAVLGAQVSASGEGTLATLQVHAKQSGELLITVKKLKSRGSGNLKLETVFRDARLKSQ